MNSALAIGAVGAGIGTAHFGLKRPIGWGCLVATTCLGLAWGRRTGWSRPIWDGYFSLIQNCVEGLRWAGYRNVASVFGTLMTDPVNAVRFGLMPTHTAGAPLRAWGLNPTQLSSIQQQNPPVILLAGKLANPGVMQQVAKGLSENPLTQNHPLFLCDWGGRVVDEMARESVWVCIRDVQKLYPAGTEVKPILVGHSWGAWAASTTACPDIPVSADGPNFGAAVAPLQMDPGVGRLILLGHPLSAEIDPARMSSLLLQALYEIDASGDILVPLRSKLAADHRMLFDTSHLGLVQLAEVIGQVVTWVANG